MRVFKELKEMMEVPEDMWQHMLLFPHEGGFMEALGGDVHLLETLDDLAQVPVWDLAGNEKTLASSAGAFDVAEVLDSSEHAVFVTVTTDTGGAMYFVPNQLWTANVLESIHLTN